MNWDLAWVHDASVCGICMTQERVVVAAAAAMGPAVEWDVALGGCGRGLHCLQGRRSATEARGCYGTRK